MVLLRECVQNIFSTKSSCFLLSQYMIVIIAFMFYTEKNIIKKKKKKGSFIAPADGTPFLGVCSSCFILILLIKTLLTFLP